MGMGASAGSAYLQAGVYGYARQQSPGLPTQPGPMIRAFPGTRMALGSPELLICAIFVGALVYLLGVHWLLGSARRVAS